MRRKDDKTFNVLQRAARVADKGHIRDAAEYCAMKDVPIDIALRVIANPKKRRKKRV